MYVTALQLNASEQCPLALWCVSSPVNAPITVVATRTAVVRLCMRAVLCTVVVRVADIGESSEGADIR